MKLMVCIPLLLCSIVWGQESLRLERGALSVVVEVGSYAEEQEFGPRFDRAGVVRSLRVHGREWLGPWGLVDEFGLYGLGVLGFDEAAPGESFVKIGFGQLLRVDGSGYHFTKRFPVQSRFRNTVTTGQHHVHITQRSEVEGPWQYSYTKTYTLTSEDTLVIQYQLTNTGDVEWSFEHYNHHWFRLEGTQPGPDYLLTTGFPLPTVSPPFVLDGNQIRLDATPGLGEAAYMAGYLHAHPDAKAEFELSVAAHATLRFTGDFEPYRFALFADPRGFCPEIFFRAKLKPGTTITWSASYHFP